MPRRSGPSSATAERAIDWNVESEPGSGSRPCRWRDERQQELLDGLGHLARLGDLDAHPVSIASDARRRRRAGVTKTAITAATAAAIAESTNALT